MKAKKQIDSAADSPALIPIDDPGSEAVSPPSALMGSGKKIFLLLAVFAGLSWGVVSLYSYVQGGGRSAVEGGALLSKVGRNPLQVTVTADGNVESASNIEVKCRVAGGSTILWIVEDGKIVEEGEEIVKLDTSAIDDKLNSQRITYEKALATQIQAQGDLEAAKISVMEYEEGTFIEQVKQVEADIQIALENLRSSENQLKYSKRMVRKGFVSSLQREADEFGVERAKLELDAANTRKKVLVGYTKQKTLKDLEAKREAAAARLRSEQAGLQLEKARLDRLQEQLKNCVITAPKKGMVVYANDSGGGRFGGGGAPQAQIEEGAMVRESQAFVRLPDLSKMRVKVTIHESRIDQITPGLRALVVIQDQEYPGTVLSIANQPQPGSWYSAKVKEYATTVSIDRESSGLRPGMTAKVTILIDDLSNALSVPVSAVVEQRGQFFCWVKSTKGSERRPLKLGRTNDKLIEVVDGVKEGEEVFRNPRAIVEEARQEPLFEKQAEDAKFSAAVEPGAAPPLPVASQGTAEKPSKAALSPAGTSPSPAALSAAESPGPGARSPPEAELRAEAAPGESGKRGGRGSFDLMQSDKDGDKKLSREELPERMQGMFERMDSNGDGFIDSSEVAEMRRRFKQGGGRPGGPGPAGEAPAGGPRDGGGGTSGDASQGGSGGTPR
jgi:multidrug resistance efflux pump